MNVFSQKDRFNSGRLLVVEAFKGQLTEKAVSVRPILLTVHNV